MKLNSHELRTNCGARLGGTIVVRESARGFRGAQKTTRPSINPARKKRRARI